MSKRKEKQKSRLALIRERLKVLKAKGRSINQDPEVIDRQTSSDWEKYFGGREQ